MQVIVADIDFVEMLHDHVISQVLARYLLVFEKVHFRCSPKSFHRVAHDVNDLNVRKVLVYIGNCLLR